MKKKIIIGVGAVALIAGTAYAYANRSTTVGYYFNGITCKQICVAVSDFTTTAAGGTTAQIRLRTGATVTIYAGPGSTVTCSGAALHLKP